MSHTRIKYRLVSRRQTSFDLEEYLGYGICILKDTGQEENPVSVLWDISDREPFVSELVDCFNRFELEPIHFMNAVEDALLSQGNGFRRFYEIS